MNLLFRILFVTVFALESTTSLLVKRDYKLETLSEDSQDLTRWVPNPHDLVVTSSCYQEYFADPCDYPGTRINASPGITYVLNQDKITACTKSRVYVVCCPSMDYCPGDWNEYVGATTVYSLHPEDGALAMLDSDLSHAAQTCDACVDEFDDTLVMELDDSCHLMDGWYLVTNEWNEICGDDDGDVDGCFSTFSWFVVGLPAAVSLLG